MSSYSLNAKWKLEDAAVAHAKVRELQRAMQRVSRERDEAVAEARRAGVSRASLALALGVNVQRIGAMIRAAEVERLVREG